MLKLGDFARPVEDDRGFDLGICEIIEITGSKAKLYNQGKGSYATYELVDLIPAMSLKDIKIGMKLTPIAICMRQFWDLDLEVIGIHGEEGRCVLVNTPNGNYHAYPHWFLKRNSDFEETSMGEVAQLKWSFA